MFGRGFALISIVAVGSCASNQAPLIVQDDQADRIAFAEQCEPWDDWDKPAPPFRIHGDTYYVGTCGIAAIYIANEFGDTLIDTGTEAGLESIIANIASLRPHISGPPMVNHVLYSHEHFDHVGGHAALQALVPDAEFYASSDAVEVFRTGVAHTGDPQFGMHDPMKPVRIDREVSAGQLVTHSRIMAIETPGHSPGALSWQWESCEGDDCKTIVYADSLSPVSSDDYRFSDHPVYVQAYREGIARIAATDCDILLTPHPSHSKMIARAAAGTLEGGMSCSEYAAGKLRDLEARLEREAGADQ